MSSYIWVHILMNSYLTLESINLDSCLWIHILMIWYKHFIYKFIWWLYEILWIHIFEFIHMNSCTKVPDDKQLQEWRAWSSRHQDSPVITRMKIYFSHFLNSCAPFWIQFGTYCPVSAWLPRKYFILPWRCQALNLIHQQSGGCI